MYKDVLVRSRDGSWEVVDLAFGGLAKFDDSCGALRHAEKIARQHGGAVYLYDGRGRLQATSTFAAIA